MSHVERIIYIININVLNLWPDSSSMLIIMYLYATLYIPILPPR